ncbi:hypothetical protein N9N71_03420 [Synechococcus sp. AH-229-G18]|nr:hypothetical protein [Synechococcus sp. AH-229-G18]
MSNIWSFAGLHLQLSSECDSAKSNYLDSGIRRELLDSDVSDTGGIIRLLVLVPLLSNSVAVKNDEYVVPEFVEFSSGEFFKSLSDIVSIVDSSNVDLSKRVRLGLEKVEPDDRIANVLMPGSSTVVFRIGDNDLQTLSKTPAFTI